MKSEEAKREASSSASHAFCVRQVSTVLTVVANISMHHIYKKSHPGKHESSSSKSHPQTSQEYHMSLEQ